MATFKNLTQFLDHFKDEATCKAYLEAQRWGGTPACPFCGVIDPYRTNRGFKCRDKACHKKFSVTVGTVYENSKIPLRIWFAAIYLCTSSKKGISSVQAAGQLGITQKSAWFLLHRVREMLRDKAPAMLRNEVQVDETYIGGKESNKHESKKKKVGGGSGGKVAVLGLVEKDGKVVTKVINSVSKDKIVTAINTHIAKGSTMVTDAFHVYKYLGESFDYKHSVVNHSVGEYVNKHGKHTNSVEGFFGLLKRGIYGIYHQVSEKHLQRYCDEFASRYNSREDSNNERFEESIRNSDGRLKYKQLTGKE